MKANLLSLIGGDTQLKKAAGTRGGEWHGPCPFCGGTDRFIVQPNYNGGRWYCRQCNERGGDAIDYVRLRDNVGYVEACERLGETPKPMDATRPREAATTPLVGRENDWLALTDAAWQEAAGAFVERSAMALESEAGAKARAYLDKRRLPFDLLAAWAVGYNDKSHREWWGETEVYLPRGIVIPWLIDGLYWRVNIRQPVGETKYLQPKGCANGLYGAELLRPGDVALLVEGEFDMLSIRAGAPDMVRFADVCPLATGSNTGAHLLRWVAKVALADTVLMAFDNDEAGDKAAAWWTSVLGSKARRLPPTRHDVNDMLANGDDMEAWIGAALGYQWAIEAVREYA